MNKIDEILESTNARIKRVEMLSIIYADVKNQQEWNTMHYHEDCQNDSSWYTAPEKGEKLYLAYKTYCEVLTAIEKLAEK